MTDLLMEITVLVVDFSDDFLWNDVNCKFFFQSFMLSLLLKMFVEVIEYEELAMPLKIFPMVSSISAAFTASALKMATVIYVLLLGGYGLSYIQSLQLTHDLVSSKIAP